MALLGKLLMRSPVGLDYEPNSLSLRSGERVRERGALGIPERFQAIFSRLSPLPGPLPARSSRGEGEDQAPSAPRGCVTYSADAPAASRQATRAGKGASLAGLVISRLLLSRGRERRLQAAAAVPWL